MTAKERKTLQGMYRSLETLPGTIRSDETLLKPFGPYTDGERETEARGAERARVLVYAWLRDANMLPPGGR